MTGSICIKTYFKESRINLIDLSFPNVGKIETKSLLHYPVQDPTQNFMADHLHVGVV